MSPELISILVLVAIFVIATLLPVHMGVLGLVAAYAVGRLVAHQSDDDIFGGFPGDLFVTIVGVTYLFAIAKDNGTVDWLVRVAVRGVGGRVALVPWVMFFVTALLTALGSVVPAAVAIVAPIGLGFAVRYRINPILMGLLIVNGASGGGFSPLSVFGGIVNGVVTREHLPSNEIVLFLASLTVNFLLSLAVFFMFGGRELLGRQTSVAEHDARAEAADDEEAVTSLDRPRALTLAGLLVLAVGALAFALDVGMLALCVGVVLTLVARGDNASDAVRQIAWPTVLLICGIVTYVAVLQAMGTVDWLGEHVADLGAPLLSAFLICVIGAAVSAFASTTGILGALIPLAVPFLQAGEVGAVGLIIALALSSSIVDSSPFSTSGALVVANAPEEEREAVFRRLMQWGMAMIAVAPVLTWLVFVVPGWG